MVGNPYLGVTSGLPVMQMESVSRVILTDSLGKESQYWASNYCIVRGVSASLHGANTEATQMVSFSTECNPG
jgi:hypothetical protein